MQFIRSIEESEKDKAITEVIINLAKSLGLGVVAEGVETANQLEFLEMKSVMKYRDTTIIDQSLLKI